MRSGSESRCRLTATGVPGVPQAACVTQPQLRQPQTVQSGAPATGCRRSSAVCCTAAPSGPSSAHRQPADTGGSRRTGSGRPAGGPASSCTTSRRTFRQLQV